MIDKRLERLLPVHYFHVVFTLPAELRAVARRSRELVFDMMLLASASQTLLALARDPKRLGGELGVTMVLHTWTRELRFHPHVHAIVTGGGLSNDDARWVRARSDFLFPVRVMGDLFRGKMLAAIEHAHMSGGLDVGRVDLRALHRKSWVVYAKRPFGGPEQVVRYLGRYTHRVGISNQRLVSMDERGVTFRTKDGRAVTVAGHELLARFVEHVLPPGFVKIRHYGLHAARHATTRLEVARGSPRPRCRVTGAHVAASRSIGASFSYACPASTPACVPRARRSPWSAPRSRSRTVVRLRWRRDRRARSLGSPARSQRGTSVPATRAAPSSARPAQERSAEHPQRAKRPPRSSPAQPLLRVSSARVRTAPKQLPHSLD
jgi:hypothetical protein